MLVSGENADIMSYYPKELFFAGIAFETKEEVLRYLCEEIAKKGLCRKVFSRRL